MPEDSSRKIKEAKEDRKKLEIVLKAIDVGIFTSIACIYVCKLIQSKARKYITSTSSGKTHRGIS